MRENSREEREEKVQERKKFKREKKIQERRERKEGKKKNKEERFLRKKSNPFVAILLVIKVTTTFFGVFFQDFFLNFISSEFFRGISLILEKQDDNIVTEHSSHVKKSSFSLLFKNRERKRKRKRKRKREEMGLK